MSYAKLAAHTFSFGLRTVKLIREGTTQYTLKVFPFKKGDEETAMLEQDIYILRRMFAISPLNNPESTFSFPPTTDDQIEDADFGRLGITKVDPITIGSELLYYEVEASG